MITFQFDRYGGGFIIEIGQCPADGITTSWGKQIPPNKVNVAYLGWKERTRIQPRAGSGTDSWFRYDRVSTGDGFNQVAQSVLPLLNLSELFPSDRLPRS